MTTLDLSLQRDAASLRSSFVAALREGDISSVESRCSDFFQRARSALNTAHLLPSTLSTLHQLAKFVAIVSTNLDELDKVQAGIQQRFVLQCREELSTDARQRSAFDRVNTNPPSPDPSNPDDPAHYLPYRLWFLSNFSSPYPSPAQKDSLLTLVPIHNKQQLDTWFTNNRRRSGWQALKREETDGTAEGMERLLRRVDREDEDVEERVRERVRKVRAFFEDGGAKDRVSEGIAAIVGGVAGPAPVSSTKTATPKRVEKRATRGVSSSSLSSPSAAFPSPAALETRLSPYCRQSTPPRQRCQQQSQPTFSYGDVVIPPSTTTASSSSFGDAFSAPRYPSTFSSPASSTRTVSSSSSSSLDSLISYASAQSTPYPIETPSSPPASSSLLSFAGPTSSSTRSTSSSTYAPYPPPSTRRTSRPNPPPQPQQLAPNPYFCTLADLPSSSSLLFGAGSSMSRR